CLAKRGLSISANCEELSITSLFGARTVLGDHYAASRLTSVGFLSSRNPRKTGWRNFSSRVHSENLISAINFGFTHCILFIIEGVIPWSHCPARFDGRSTKGQSSRSSPRNFLCKIDNDSLVKPLPTLPANFNLPFS